MAKTPDLDLDLVLERMQIVSADRSGRMEVFAALVEDPEINRGIDGASTLRLTLADPERKLITSTKVPLDERCWVELSSGLIFELVGLDKGEDTITLVFEDSIIAELRRKTKKLSVKPRTITRAEWVTRLAKEAKVPLAVDPAKRGLVKKALTRSVGGTKESSWDCISDAASTVNWRAFSDGSKLIVGSDDWIIRRDKQPTVLREYTGGCHNLGWKLDIGRPMSDASAEVDVASLDLGPGQVVEVVGQGPADGLWLVSGNTRTLCSPRASLSLVRERHALKEPKGEPNATKGDAGETAGYLPGTGAVSDSSTGTAATAAREKMVQAALAQAGKPYVWSASGPSAFDCSGLVQWATAAAGHVLAKPSYSQLAAVQAAGKLLSVEQAMSTRGALLFIQGDAGRHVAISLGNGQTIEAKDPARGVGVFPAFASSYTHGGWWI